MSSAALMFQPPAKRYSTKATGACGGGWGWEECWEESGVGEERKCMEVKRERGRQEAVCVCVFVSMKRERRLCVR